MDFERIPRLCYHVGYKTQDRKVHPSSHMAKLWRKRWQLFRAILTNLGNGNPSSSIVLHGTLRSALKIIGCCGNSKNRLKQSKWYVFLYVAEKLHRLCFLCNTLSINYNILHLELVYTGQLPEIPGEIIYGLDACNDLLAGWQVRYRTGMVHVRYRTSTV